MRRGVNEVVLGYALQFAEMPNKIIQCIGNTCISLRCGPAINSGYLSQLSVKKRALTQIISYTIIIGAIIEDVQ